MWEIVWHLEFSTTWRNPCPQVYQMTTQQYIIHIKNGVCYICLPTQNVKELVISLVCNNKTLEKSATS